MLNLFCRYCGGAVLSSADRCPHCAASFSTIRCPACVFAGAEEDFPGNRCPQCGCARLVAE